MERVPRATADGRGPRPERVGAPSCNDRRVSARVPIRGTSVAAVFGGAALLAFLCTPGVAPSARGLVDALAMSRPLASLQTAPVLPDDVDPFTFFSTTTPIPAAPPSAPDAAAPSAADRAAGIGSRSVEQTGSGEFDVVPGSAAAPGRGPVRTVRVEVERGLPVDGTGFADFVLATLNDDRSWGHDGAMTFARTDGDAPIAVVLASPETSAQLCGDVRTHGMLSCRNGQRAVLTFHRWVNATDEYADNATGYRQYVVNHEVGHALGHGHERCPGPGEPAPVMQQQTLGLKGCAQNSWPYPGEPSGEPLPSAG